MSDFIYDDIISSYYNWLVLKNYKERGIEEKLRALKKYLNFTNKNKIDVYRINIRNAESYKEHLRLLKDNTGKTKYNSKTINGQLSYLKLFYQYLLSNDLTLNNPFLHLRRLKESYNLPKRILTVKEIGKFLNSIEIKNDRDFLFKLVVELLYATGLRISEVENLRREDVLIDEGYLKIKDDKSRQNRNAPLTEYVIKLLKIYLRFNKKTCPFAHANHKRGLNSFINYKLKEHAKRINLPYFSCHSLRHMVATHLLKAGADIREVQELLGHKRIKNTEVYTRIFPEDLKEVIENLHPRERRCVNEAS